MKINKKLADIVILKELGQRLEIRRVSINLTQAALAKQSGVSKRTIERIEAGHSSEFINVIRISRVLDFIDNFDNLIDDHTESPIELVKKEKKKPKRASSKRKNAEKLSKWTWGEE